MARLLLYKNTTNSHSPGKTDRLTPVRFLFLQIRYAPYPKKHHFNTNNAASGKVQGLPEAACRQFIA